MEELIARLWNWIVDRIVKLISDRILQNSKADLMDQKWDGQNGGVFAGL